MHIDSHSRVRLLLGLVALLSLSGCGKVPTWDEMTKGGQTTSPAQPAQAPTQPAEAPPVVQAPVVPVVPAKPNAQQVIATFKAIAPPNVDNGAILQVCALDEGLEEITEILADQSKVTDDGLVNLGKLTSLKTLSLAGARITEAGCANIAQSPSLETLTLTGGMVNDQGAAHLSQLQHLKKLIINGTQLSLAGWEQVGKMPSLEELWIQQSSIDDAGMEAICNARTLRSLHINDTSVTDRGLVFLRKLEVLNELNLSGCPITGDGLGGAIKAKGLKTLTSLIIQRTPLNDKGAQAIGAITSLEALNIAELRGMTDKHFAMMVKSKKNLRYLNAHTNLGLTNDSLKALRDLTELEQLHVSGSAMNNQGLTHLRKLTNLKVFGYGGTQITNDEVVKILPQLAVTKSKKKEADDQ